jgi:hypothetical protein
MFRPFKEVSQVHELSGWFGSIEKAHGNTSCILHVYNVHHMVECRFCIKIDQNTVPNACAPWLSNDLYKLHFTSQF